MSWIKAIPTKEIEVGQVRVVVVEEERLAVCRLSEREFYTIEDTCSHDDGPLGEGTLVGRHIECPRHGARFDVTNGKVVRMPAAAPIESFPTRVSEDGWVEVDLDG